MTDLVNLARQRIGGTQRSHWEGCERDHWECLIQRMADEIERLRDTLKRQETAHHREVQEQTAADEALLRQALEAMQRAASDPTRFLDLAWDHTVAALRERLRETPPQPAAPPACER